MNHLLEDADRRPPRPPVAARRGSRSAAGAALLLFLLAGCASYPERTHACLQMFRAGRLEEARAQYADPGTTGSDFLSGAEAGMVALTAGRWDRALEHLGAAADASRAAEERALVSAENLGEGLISATLSESAKTYEGEGFERVMLHSCLAMAYLAEGRIDDVWVECRLANRLLEREEELYEVEYAAGGLGHFLSATAYELLGQPDEAYIDYLRMHDKGVGGGVAGPALLRLAGELGWADDLERWRRHYGEPPRRPESAAAVVVIAGVGLGPFKEEIRLDIPTHDGLLSWSVPSLLQRPQPVAGLVLELPGSGRAVRTEPIEDVARVARENLEHRIGWLAARSAVRAVLKRELTQALAREYDIWGRLAGDLFTLITERADLRAWQTLPDSWQAVRVFVPAGRHELVLTADGGPRRALGRFELGVGETMFIFARTVDHELYAHPVGGLPVGEVGGGEPAGAASIPQVP